MSDRRKLSLVSGSAFEITGCGDDLKLKISAHRKKKTGAYEFFEIELDIGRYQVQRIARQVATMHERDRQRIARETARIEKEIAAIQQPDSEVTK